MQIKARQGAPIPPKKKRAKRYSEPKEPRYLLSNGPLRIMPNRRITADHIPARCLCKWDYHVKERKWQLKFYNNACPIRSFHG